MFEGANAGQDPDFQASVPPEDPTQGQGAGTEQPGGAGAPQESSEVIDVGGHKFSSIEELQKAYMESKKAMDQAFRERADTVKQLKEFQERYSWAQSYEEWLAQHPEKRQEIEAILNETGPSYEQAPRHVPDPILNDLWETKKTVKELKIERELDALAARGFPVDSARRAKVYEYLYRTDDDDVEGAYKKLFFEEELERAKQEAIKKTGEAMAANQSAYQPPPSSGSPPSNKSVTEMSEDEIAAAIEERIRQSDILP
jgi:hypothetical protein